MLLLQLLLLHLSHLLLLLRGHLLLTYLGLELGQVSRYVGRGTPHHLPWHHPRRSLPPKRLLVSLHLIRHHLLHHGVLLLLLLLLLQEHSLVPLASNHLTLPMHQPLALLGHHLLRWGHPSSLPGVEGPGEDSLTLALTHLAGGGGHGLGLVLEAHHLGLEARLRLAHAWARSGAWGLACHTAMKAHNIGLGVGGALHGVGSRYGRWSS